MVRSTTGKIYRVIAWRVGGEGRKRLACRYPRDLGIAGDRIVISIWAGHDADAVQLNEQLPPTGQPDYVVDAAARAYRNLHR
jgi:hypothetical protein